MRIWIPVTLLVLTTVVGCSTGRKNRRAHRPVDAVMAPSETLAEPPASYSPVESVPSVTPMPPSRPAAKAKPKAKQPSIALPKPE